MHARDKYYASLLQAKSTAVALCGEPDIAVLSIDNHLDARAASLIRSRFKRLIAGGRSDAVVDLTKVAALNSTSLGSFVCALRAMHRIGASIVLVADGGLISRMLELTALTRLFRVHASVGAAIASFSSAAA
ncbi:MAG TPA: STAS domain-containing protein [Candidatus Eremiobacteraceae bacterium]|nr:STAS domain-containing protein [Candidatus Eremiobacteraceae bacterium]